MNTKSEQPGPSNSLPRLVRQFVVQERCRGDRKQNWWDDPDQPPETMNAPELASGWLAKDCRETLGHKEAYEHRILERTEQVCHPASDIDRMLIL